MYIVKIGATWAGDNFERIISFSLVYDWLAAQGVQFVEEPAGHWSSPYRNCTAVVTADQSVKLFAIDSINAVVQCEVKQAGTIERLLAKTEELIAKVGSTDEFNGRVNVHMPGNLLLQFNETLLLENSCTDALQEAMDKGWRIIAASPQPDQRRPDYIMGRFNPEISNYAGARRLA